MWVIKAVNIGKEIDGQLIFSQIDLEIPIGERVALIGRNGIGKTTLLRCLVGNYSIDAGSLNRSMPPQEYGYMEQQVETVGNLSLFAFVCSVDAQWWSAKQRLLEVETLLSSSSDVSDDVIVAFAKAQEEYMALDGYRRESEVEHILRRLQFTEGYWQRPFLSLSGGEKTRASLARLMIRNPQFLLLDEPTNHLDTESLAWLESWLREYKGTILCVSHDRQFIDAVATITYELTRHGMKSSRGGYTVYREQRELQRRSQLHLYQQQERERSDLLQAIQQYKEWFHKGHDAASERDPYAKKRAAKNAKRYQAKKRSLEQLEARRVDKPEAEIHARVGFADSQFEARHLLTLHDVSVSLGQQVVIRQHSLSISRGDRIGVIGRNGAGKSTLLRLMVGEIIPSTGYIQRHPALRVGYFEQELHSLAHEQSILSAIMELPDVTQSFARTLLAGFLFVGDEVHRRMSQLSMGERCRVAFLRLYLSQANLLVLDEPTNYLDIDTRERMEEALLSYPGSVVLVSHDRYLVEKVCNRIVAIEAGVITDFHGTRAEYELKQSTRSQVGESLERANEMRRLELTLTHLLAQEEPADEQGRRQLWDEIREIKRRMRDGVC